MKFRVRNNLCICFCRKILGVFAACKVDVLDVSWISYRHQTMNQAHETADLWLSKATTCAFQHWQPKVALGSTRANEFTAKMPSQQVTGQDRLENSGELQVLENSFSSVGVRCFVTFLYARVPISHRKTQQFAAKPGLCTAIRFCSWIAYGFSWWSVLSESIFSQWQGSIVRNSDKFGERQESCYDVYPNKRQDVLNLLRRLTWFKVQMFTWQMITWFTNIYIFCFLHNMAFTFCTEDGLAGRPGLQGPPAPFNTPRRRFPAAGVSQVDGWLGSKGPHQTFTHTVPYGFDFYIMFFYI